MRQKHEAQKRLAAAQAAAAASAAVAGKKTEDGGHAISKEELQGLLKEFAPDETFEDGVEELLLEITDDFVDNLLDETYLRWSDMEPRLSGYGMNFPQRVVALAPRYFGFEFVYNFL